MLFGREFHRVGATKENSTAKLQLTAEYDASDGFGAFGLALALLARYWLLQVESFENCL